MNKKAEYALGIVLVGIVGTIIMPFFAIVMGIVRLFIFAIDVLGFPYNCMVAYHENFERKKSFSDALKKIAEDLDSNRNN